MPKLLQLGKDPVLGRLAGFTKKYGLRGERSKLEGLPDIKTIEVLRPDQLEQVDVYSNVDEVLLGSSRFVEALRTVVPNVVVHEVDAQDRTVFLIEPVADDDVSYEADTSDYSSSGYNVMEATQLRVEDEVEDAFVPVRNTGILAISDALVDAARAAGVRWTLEDTIEHFVPFRAHPYALLLHDSQAAHVETFSGPLPPTGPKPHPLAPWLGLTEASERNEQWARVLNDEDSPREAATARYSSGEILPPITGVMDDDVSKRERSTRRKAAQKAQYANSHGLPVIGARLADALRARSLDLEFSPFSLRDDTLDEAVEFQVLYPKLAVDWIDWTHSDVELSWNGEVEAYFELHPTPESYAASHPIVRIAGTPLVLVHESIFDLFDGMPGIELVPLHQHSVARNLDDNITFF
ncbi:MAG: hypothetical protein H6730_23865 [Deltaproteobacteria bacterium]|nr:hypothetical protein [Deltaproteobacteria bacterium]